MAKQCLTAVARFGAVGVVAGLMLLAGCSEPTEQLGGQNSPSLNDQDNMWFKKITIANYTEIDSSQLALSQAQNPEVKQFAQKMISDHQMAANKVMALAAQKGVTLPQRMDTMHQKMVDGLRDKSGSDFDKAYVDLQVTAHKEVVSADKTEADDGSDPQVKQLAAELLPTLQMHLNMAEELQNGKAMSGASGM